MSVITNHNSPSVITQTSISTLSHFIQFHLSEPITVWLWQPFYQSTFLWL